VRRSEPRPISDAYEKALKQIGCSQHATLVRLRDLATEALSNCQKLLPIQFGYDPDLTTWAAVREILEQADLVGKAGPVAQYLVGAKLQLRFPGAAIANDRYSAPDAQTGRQGDFQVEDTAFHVTVSPTPPVYDKCLHNTRGGLRVYLLVPDSCLVGARQNAQTVSPDRIAVESVESFVANNIEELSQFAKNELKSAFRRLLETYNKRVDAIELDKSLLMEIPASLF